MEPANISEPAILPWVNRLIAPAWPAWIFMTSRVGCGLPMASGDHA